MSRLGDSGFDDMDSIYASPEDFKTMKNRDKKRGHDLLEFFVQRCHEIGVCYASHFIYLTYIYTHTATTTVFLLVNCNYLSNIPY